MNYYQRHVGDITRDTFGLSPAEFGCYDRMLDYYYQTEKPLPLELSEIHRITGARTRADCKAGEYVLQRYFTETADGWHQKRCDAELEDYVAKADIARVNGKRGGRPRNPEITQPVSRGIPRTNPDLTHEKANQEPVTSNQEPGVKQKPRARAAPAALPDWLPAEAWQEWARHRRGKLTPEAAKRQIAKLDELRHQGHAPASVIGLAIERGWSSFYEPKGGTGSRRLSAVGQRTADNLRQFIDEEPSNGTHGP